MEEGKGVEEETTQGVKSEARSATEDEFDALEKFMEGRLGLPASFLDEVSKESDWTLVIKLHAMIESALNELLIIRFNAPEELKGVIARIDTGDTQRGKIAFAHKFGWVEKHEMTFVCNFSTLRNFLVHDAKNFGFQLTSYAGTLKDGDAWIRLLARFIPEGMIYLDEKVSSLEHAKQNLEMGS